MLDDYICYSALGDFEERFHSTVVKKGHLSAFLFIRLEAVIENFIVFHSSMVNEEFKEIKQNTIILFSKLIFLEGG